MLAQPLSYLILPPEIAKPALSNLSVDLRLPSGHRLLCTDDLEPAIASKTGDDAFVLVAGLLVDLRSNTISGTEVASSLLASARVGTAAFLSHLDEIAGRYIVIYCDGRSAPRIYGDACGALKINYHHDSGVIGSNIYMMAQTLGIGRRNVRPEYSKNPYRKDSTFIFLLTFEI